MSQMEDRTFRLQEKTIREVVNAISPWIDIPSKPMTIKLKNTTIGTHQVTVTIEEGMVVIELKTRVAHPTRDTFIIPRDEEKIIAFSDDDMEPSEMVVGPNDDEFGPSLTR